jgi:HEAT repeat protein
MKQSQNRLIRLAIVVAISFVLEQSSKADFWGPPQREHWSSNRHYVLRVGWPFANLTLFKVTKDGAERNVWSQPSVDGAPHMAYVADDGQHVVMRDRHANLGYGKVLTFLGPKGNVLQAYELADLLTQEQILDSCATVSSIWWSTPGWFDFLKGQQQFAFVTYHGAMDCFDVATGKRVSLDAKKRSEIQACALKEILPLLESADGEERCRGAQLCGAIRAVEAVPSLKKLLASHSDDTAKVAAATALASIITVKSVPLIEEQLVESSRDARYGLLSAIGAIDSNTFGVIVTPQSAELLAAWRRFAKSPLADVREFAVEALLERDSAQCVYDRPELLKSSDEGIRRRAVRCLTERGDKRAIPLLRSAMNDGESSIRLWAFRGLAKYKPDDILDVIHHVAADKDGSVRYEAAMELARQGDKDAIAWFVDRTAALKDHKHDPKGMGSEHIYTPELCEFIVELKPPSAETALRQAYTNKCDKIRRPISGALAAFGDRAALRDLRQFASKGDALDRSGSIKMLGLVGDTESIPALRKALDDREPWVREAAKQALAVLERNAKGTRATDVGGKK